MAASNRPKQEIEPSEPVDVADGIPDRSPARAKWKLVVIGLIFLAWVAVLVFIRIAGQPK